MWIYDLEDDSFRQLTYEGKNGSPVWTPDGKWITFTSDRDGPRNLYRKRADGSSGTERLTTSQSTQIHSSWSPDGNVLAFSDGAPKSFDISILLMEGAPTPRPFITSPHRDMCPQFSPDGQWLAYFSNEPDHSGVYIRPYPEPEIKWLVSGKQGGIMVPLTQPKFQASEPMWSPAGSELFYYRDGKMMVASIQTQPKFQASPPRVLFEGSYFPAFDISPDGQRFLMAKQEPRREDGQINVVLNWFEELKRLVPTVNSG